MTRKLLLHLVWLLVAGFILPQANAQEQKPAYWDEIQAFKQQDSLQMPPQQAILFTGSSSIRMWQDMQQMLPDYTVINRGFGGSTLADLQRYLPDIVFPYKPKQIVMYSGENDIATDAIKAPEVLARFKQVFTGIRKQLPQVPIVYISIKPSPSRMAFKPEVLEANKLIRQYLARQTNARFVDVYTPMLNKNGKPKPEIFLEDSLHMNNKGYQIWKKALTPYLLK
ncbi:SGNH/GDSL hydrolase family protein [Pontibacter liquoris]|uniref:SGNH/GDSL hydrolase family protein n=1 Tax=Pontibacter liquoris TaxID=2905677 RepID=UPI001FA6C978|nr:SGNH/GDSL hydrolase family protein [Pontibacter liquoris]